MSDIEQSAYWLLSDDRLALCSTPSQLGLFKAHFKHALLFNQVLVVPDSYVVNNYNFRHALSHDPDFRQLIRDQTLRVACRKDKHGRVMSLVEVRNGMAQNKMPREFSDEEYASDDDLKFIDDIVVTESYSLENVSLRYAVKAVDVFQSRKASERLGSEVARVVAELSREHSGIGQDSKICDPELASEFGRAFYFYKLKNDLFERATGQKWEHYEDRIFALANAPYLTALPSLLDLEPIYAPQHAEAFEITRSSRGEPSEVLDQFSFSSRLGLNSFVKGMELLTCDDVHRLVETDEGKHLRALLGNEQQQVEGAALAAAIRGYQMRIEDCIITRHNDIDIGSMDGNRKIMQITFDEVAGGLSDALVYLSLTFSSLASWNPLGLVLTKPFRAAIKHTTGIQKREDAKELARQAQLANREHLREEILEEFMEDEYADRIDAVGYWGDEGKEVLYADIQ